MRFAIPEIVKAGGGAIVNISSVAGIRYSAGVAYQATKAGILGLSLAAAVRHARDKVRVNTVLPGLINSSMVRRLHGRDHAPLRPPLPLLGPPRAAPNPHKPPRREGTPP